LESGLSITTSFWSETNRTALCDLMKKGGIEQQKFGKGDNTESKSIMEY